MNTYLIEISKDKRDSYWFFNKGLVDDFSHALAPGKLFDNFHSNWARRYVYIFLNQQFNLPLSKANINFFSMASLVERHIMQPLTTSLHII